MERIQESGSDNASTSPSSKPIERGTDPVFPAELEREIFETTAMIFPQFAPTLTLVAKRVQQWIELRIYEVLVFQSSGNCCPPLYDEKESERIKRSNFEKATAYARSVLLEGIDASIIIEVLQSCKNVTNLMLWSAEHEALNQLILSLPVERLSVNVLELAGFENQRKDAEGKLVDFKFDHTFFVNLTHLDVIYIPKSVRSWDKWRNLSLLPRLTHLSLYASTVEMVERVLEECEHIRLLVLIYQENAQKSGDEFGNGRYPDEGVFKDKRVVQIVDRNSGDWVDDWIAGAHGGEDFWITAEKIQAEVLNRIAHRVPSRLTK